MEFVIGKKYEAVLNHTFMSLTIIDVDHGGEQGIEYFVEWSDRDQEWLYESDLIRYVKAAAFDL